MANPTLGDFEINLPLTDVAIAYNETNDAGFIAADVFPVVEVKARSGTYKVWQRADSDRPESRRRAPGAESVGIGLRVTDQTYTTARIASHQDMDKPTRVEAEASGEVDNLRDFFATNVEHDLLLTRELEFAATYFKPGVWGLDYAGIPSGTPTGNQFLRWTDAASTPIQDMTKLARTLTRNSKYRPNRMVIGPNVYDTLKTHPQISGRLNVGGQVLARDEYLRLLAALFDVERVVVPERTYNTQSEGITATYSDIYSNGVLLAYAAPRPSRFLPSAGYIFAWTGMLGADAYAGAIQDFLIPEKDMTIRIEGEMWYGMARTALDAAAFVDAIV